MQKIKNGVSAVVLFLVTFCFGYLTILSPDKINERAGFLHANAQKSDIYLFVVAGAIILSILIIFLFRLLDKLNRRGLILASAVMFAVMALIGVFLLKNFLVVPSTDSYAVVDQALKISKGEATTIDGYLSYFDDYSNNNLFVLSLSGFFKILAFFNITKVFDIYFWSIVFNGIFMLLGTYLTFETVRKIKGLKTACKILVFFCLNPLFYMMMFWVYTCSVSVPFMVLGVYLAVVVCKSKSQKVSALCGAGLGALTVVGYFLRPTCVIPLIALAIGSIFYVNKGNIKKLATTGVCAVVLFSVTFFFINNYINSMTVSTSKNFPLTHWIMMGLYGDGTVNEGDNDFTRSFESKEKSSVAIGQVIDERMNKMTTGDLLSLAGKKALVTFGDGSGGYNMRVIQDTKFTPLYTYLVEGKIDAFLLYAQMFRVATLGLCFVSAFMAMIRRKADYLFVFHLTVLGGILFYIIWEAKNAYSIPFLPFMFVLATDGADRVSDGVRKVKSFPVVVAFCALLLCTTTAFALNQKPKLTESVKPFYNYSVYSHTNQFNRKDLTLRKMGVSLTQEFYAHKPFNKIEIKARRVRADENSKYIISLKERDEVIKQFVVNPADVDSDGCIKIDFDKIKPKGNTKYIIEITPLPLESGKVNDSIIFIHRFSQTTDQYKGVMKLGGKSQQTDLHLRVYEEYLAPYVSEQVFNNYFYKLVAAELLLFAVIVYLTIRKRRTASIDLDSNTKSRS